MTVDVLAEFRRLAGAFTALAHQRQLNVFNHTIIVLLGFDLNSTKHLLSRFLAIAFGLE